MLRYSTFLLLALVSAALGADSTDFTIKTLKAQMRYDTTVINAAVGATVKIHFVNGDDMPHNMIFCQAGTDVLALSNKQMEKPEEALKRDFLPDDPAVWAHSTLLKPGGEEDFTFTAPDKVGDYPFVCTMPGHAATMNGILRVSIPGGSLSDLKFKFYLGDWRNLPDFSKLQPHKEGDVPSNLVEIKLDDYQNHFGIVYTGKLDAPATGEYIFNLSSDDGARIRVDGKEVVDYDGTHGAAEIREGKIHLEKGAHEFRLDYFQGDGDAQLYVAWGGPGFSMTPLSKWVKAPVTDAAPKKIEHPEMVLTPKNEPILYRNFIAGAGTRGIGVGFPGLVNIAWSAATMNVAIIWRGAFIDASKHWVDRGGGYQTPLGYDVFRPAGDGAVPFAVLATPTAPWPKIEMKSSQRAEGYDWKGYALDEKRVPTFNYTWKGLRVSDRYDPQTSASGQGSILRTLKLVGPIPKNAYFRVASGEKIDPQGAGFLVNGGGLSLEGQNYPNQFVVSVEGAKIVGDSVLVPLRSELKVTYTWPDDHSQHIHASK